MRGPIDGVPGLLQPVAHALLQAVEDAEEKLLSLSNDNLWARPNGVASIGFHLLHMHGVVDRMFTYANENALSEEQFTWLKSETVIHENKNAGELIAGFKSRVQLAVEQLKDTNVATLTDTRYLGRKRIPTTLIGLLFHAAEHIQRHIGQALVTAKMVN